MKIQLKRSNVQDPAGVAKEPTAGQMEYGELAVNYNESDPAIFLKDSNDNIIRISGVGNISDDGQVELPSSSSPPASAEPGNLWYNSEDGRLYIYYKDGNSEQWVDASPDSWDPSTYPDTDNPAQQPGSLDDRYVMASGDDMTGDLTLGTDKITLDASDGSITAAGDIQSTSQNGGQLAGFRNQIINGDFRVWQRGGVFSNLAALNSGVEYTADHVFVYTVSASSGAIEFDRGNVTGLEGFAGCLQNNTNVTAYVSFPIELDRLGGFASPFIVGKTYTASWYQTDSTQLGNNLQFKVSSDASSFTAECTEVGALKAESTGVRTWTRYSQSFTMVDPSGASPTLLALTVLVGGGQSITGVQLEPGPVATPFEHRPIGTELALCQRYYLQGWSLGQQLITTAGTVKRAEASFPVTMRAVPTITEVAVNDGNVLNTAPNPNGVRFKINSAGPTTDGQVGDWVADAEL